MNNSNKDSALADYRRALRDIIIAIQNAPTTGNLGKIIFTIANEALEDNKDA